jgi:ABC-2 type transport system ATP-binding protein
MTAPVIEFRDVTRTFGRRRALDGVSLAVQPGEVVALVGRNGAGKTTALRLGHGVLWPDTGAIRVLGLDPVRQGLDVRTRASLLSEESALYPWMTVREILAFGGALAPRWDARLASSLVERLGLEPGAKIRTLSRGTKAKVALALAVAARPEVLLLDDPTAGLDPLVRREVLEGILEALPGEGGAVLYASHLINDLERVADRVVFLDAGRIRLEGSIVELKQRVRRLTAVFEDTGPPSALEALAAATLDRRLDGRALTMIVEAAHGAAVEGHLRALGDPRLHWEPLDLEEILIAALRSGEARRETVHV